MNTNPTTPDENRPPDALMNLLSNPEALRRMATVLGTVLSTPSEGQKAPSTVVEATTPSADHGSTHEKEPPDSRTNFSTAASATAAPSHTTGTMDGLQAILSNPAMLEQLPKLLAVMKPMLTAMPPQKPTSELPKKPEDCRNNLLQALKPFLSPARGEAIDSIIRISHLGNVFSQLK